jgi:hypothetical protein
MKTESQEYFKAMMEMLQTWQSHHDVLLKGIHTDANINELADYTYTVRKISDMLVEMSKRTRNTYELAERLLCMLWAQVGDPEPIRTPYCTITPKIRMAAQIPKKGTEEYEKLMTALGITLELAQVDAVRPHWPGMTEYVTQRLTEGKPLPPGIDPHKTYPVYGVLIRDKKGITE